MNQLPPITSQFNSNKLLTPCFTSFYKSRDGYYEIYKKYVSVGKDTISILAFWHFGILPFLFCLIEKSSNR